MAALALVIATAAGCAQVKQTAADASAGLDRLFGSESKAEAQEASTQEAEQLYRAGLAERERGAKKAAFAQFLEAAELGHGPAAYETGMAYKDGRGTARDLEAGADWINKAAERGERRAQYLTGAAYYHGTGVEQNYEVAVGHLADAAVQDLPAAQFLLAQAFANGRGVPMNAPWAARWYGKAAAHGLPEAQYAYGVVHSAGLGLPQNPERGYAWLRIAEGNGYKEAHRVADALEGKMSPEQLASAKVRVAAFEPRSETRFADPPTIMYVERMLNSLGFKAGPVDGRLGKMSRAAIRKYQESRGLTADGKVKPKLLRSLLDEQKAAA
jgi:localization factor PodJL